MEKEIWKPIKNYEGLYEISNLGKVRSLPRLKHFGERIYTTKTRILRSSDNGYGYKIVTLCKNNKHKKAYVHHLVAQTFIPNHNKLPEINHIDGIKENNAVDNLEWITRADNIKHAIATGLSPSGSKSKRAKLSKKQARIIKKQFISGVPTRRIANEFKVGINAVINIATGKTFINDTKDIPNYNGDVIARGNLLKIASQRNSSGYTGVNFDRSSGKWRARANYKGKVLVDKTFPTMQEAIDCRNKVLKRFTGIKLDVETLKLIGIIGNYEEETR